MIDLGKGVSVDFKDNPYVFGIDGYDPIRIQKGDTRINGVTVEQLELIVKTVKESKNGHKHAATDTKRTATRKTRSASSRSSKAYSVYGSKS